MYPTSLLQVVSSYTKSAQEEFTNSITSSWMNDLLLVSISYALTVSISVFATELLAIVKGYVKVFCIKYSGVVDEFTISNVPTISCEFSAT